MTKITHEFLRPKCKRTIRGLSLFVLFLMGTQVSWGQQPIGTGQFDGGFENAVFNTAQLSANSPDASKWSHDSTSNLGTSSIVSDVNNSRSGSKSFNLISTVAASGKYIMSPILSPALLAGVGNNYTVQYYIKSSTLLATKGAIFVSSRGSGSGTQGTADVKGWQKVTYRYNGVVTAAGTFTWAGIGTNLNQTVSGYVDDVVIYVGTDDNTVPDAPTTPVVAIASATTLNVGWTAPGTGVDSGGYVVIRYATSPSADNDPNQNGIYAVGNTTTNGTGSLTGTVVYVGTSTSFVDTVADSSVSYYYKIYTADKAFNYSAEITGIGAATSTTWNGSAWSNGNPSATIEAIIAGTYNGAAFDAKKVTVNSGSMTITSGTMTIQNEVINNVGVNGIVFENDANLIQVNSTVNTGNVVVKRNSSPLLLFDYTLWSSPVAGQNLAAFSPLTSLAPNRFYIYDSASDKYTNTIPVTLDPTTTNFSPGAGYLIRMPNTADAGTPTAYPGVFTGVPNNGDVPFTLSTAGIGGYNLVGNPYASPINLFTLQADNASSIGNTFYMWRKTNGEGTAYCSYIPTSAIAGTYVSNGNSQSPVTFVGNIQIGQGFFVSAITAGPLVFKNGQRVSTASSFFKTKQITASDKVWLNATNAAGDFSQMAVTYFDGATQGVDAFDGKYFNDSAFALTSNINGGDYVIQGRPSFDVSDGVQLNFKTNVAGDYTIAIDHSEGVFATGQDVYLVDSKTGTETNLKSSSYSFTAASGVDNARFSLKFQKTLKIDTPAFNENSVTVYKNNGTLYINSGSVSIANVKVFDIQGRLIAEQKNVKANVTSVNNLKANQALIVQVISEDNTVVNKKVVN